MKIPSARKLPSGRWFIRVSVDGKSYNGTFDTEKQAVAWAAQVKNDAKSIRPTGRMTLTAAIDKYIDVRSGLLSPSTVRGYRIIQKNRFQNMMTRDIFSATEAEWRRAVALDAKRYSGKTVINSWRFISSVITETTGQKITVSLPQDTSEELPWLTPDQIQIFVEAIKGDPAEVAALLALSSLRRSELDGLDMSDIDLDAGVIRVRDVVVLDENNQRIKKRETKNKTSRREVPIIPPLAEAIKALPYTTGKVIRITPTTASRRINEICREAGLPEVALHGLRRSFASLAYHLAMPERVAMKIGGWSNIQTMHNIYVKIADSDVVKNASAFTAFFDSD